MMGSNANQSQYMYEYVGIASFVWYLIWLLVVKNDPSDDKRMSEEEKTYIKDKVNCDYDNTKVNQSHNI